MNSSLSDSVSVPSMSLTTTWVPAGRIHRYEVVRAAVAQHLEGTS